MSLKVSVSYVATYKGGKFHSGLKNFTFTTNNLKTVQLALVSGLQSLSETSSEGVEIDFTVSYVATYDNGSFHSSLDGFTTVVNGDQGVSNAQNALVTALASLSA